MARLYKIFQNTYRDSVSLMQISAVLKDLTGITNASLIMATKTNIELLREVGLIDTAPDAGNNDLLIELEGKTKKDVENAAVVATSNLNEITSENLDFGIKNKPPRSIEMALNKYPNSNLALISCPGDYAAAEAMKALNLGLDVMLFSDNVSTKDEVLLKKHALAKKLLMMGPDCGTAIVNGIPLGFSNKVKKGNIGIVAASGTGLQQVSCLIDRWGGGVSQALGTGGRDLNADVGGITMMFGIDALVADRNTSVIVVISKPPSPKVAEAIFKKVSTSAKPVVVNFLSDTGNSTSTKLIKETKTLEETAYTAVCLAGIDIEAPARHLVTPAELGSLTNSLSGTQRYLRALYSGGTFGFEAITILSESLEKIHSTTPLSPEDSLSDPWQSKGHTVLDLGSDVFTRGRPHPMIDHSLRNKRMIQEAKDPETAIILLDIVLGFGSHQNPAKDMAAAITQAREVATGHEPIFIGFVCGTNGDPQNLIMQERILSEVGVLLMESNAQAARLAGDIICGLNAKMADIP